MLKDPLFRRFISSSAFAGAFIWVAVRYFEVDTEVVWVLFELSFVFVGILIVVGLILAPTVSLFRRKSSLLSKLDASPNGSQELINHEGSETSRKP